MIVRIPDLSDEVRLVDFREQATVINEVLGAGHRVVDRRFDSDVRVQAEVYRHGTDVYFIGSVAGKVTCTCPRCLDEFEWPLARKFRFLIVKADAAETFDDDTGLDHYEGDELDLGRLAREQVLLGLDESVLCSEDCKGLCAGCGANRNHEPCTCEPT